MAKTEFHIVVWKAYIDDANAHNLFLQLMRKFEECLKGENFVCVHKVRALSDKYEKYVSLIQKLLCVCLHESAFLLQIWFYLIYILFL